MPIGGRPVKKGDKLIITDKDQRQFIGMKVVAVADEIDGPGGYSVRVKGENMPESTFHVSNLAFDTDEE